MAKFITPTKQLEMEPIIVAELIQAKGKDAVKQVANKLKIDQDFVRHIYNTRKIGQKKQELEEHEKELQLKFTDNISTPAAIVNISNLYPNQELTCNMSIEYNKELENSNIKPAEEIKVSLKEEGAYFINDDIKLQVVMDYESGEYTYETVAKKYNISKSSAYRIIKEIGGENVKSKKKSNARRKSSSGSRSYNNHQRRKTIKELEKKYVGKSFEEVQKQEAIEDKVPDLISKIEEKSIEKNIDKQEKKNIVVAINEPIKTVLHTSYKLEQVKETATKAGLCSDRHEMNVEIFIYNTLSEDEMFNYPQLYNRAVNFIKENCPSNTLHLYCTGIQCALAAVIKACHDLKVTLSLFHYNAAKSIYMRQDVWKYSDNYIDEITAAYADIMRKGPVYTFGGKINSEEFYTISVNHVKEKSDGFISQAYVVCDTIENAFKLYADYVKDINDKENCKTRKAVFLTKCKVEKGKFIWNNNLSKSFNYK